MPALFLDKRSRKRLQAWLADDYKVHGISYALLWALRHGEAKSITVAELTALSDYKFPTPLSDVIMPADFHVREV